MNNQNKEEEELEILTEVKNFTGKTGKWKMVIVEPEVPIPPIPPLEVPSKWVNYQSQDDMIKNLTQKNKELEDKLNMLTDMIEKISNLSTTK